MRLTEQAAFTFLFLVCTKLMLLLCLLGIGHSINTLEIQRKCLVNKILNLLQFLVDLNLDITDQSINYLLSKFLQVFKLNCYVTQLTRH